MADKYAGKSLEELQQAARDRGLPVSGSKQEVTDRLRAADQQGDQSVATASQAQADQQQAQAETTQADADQATAAGRGGQLAPASESSDPAVHALLADLQTARSNENEADIQAATKQLADLGYEAG